MNAVELMMKKLVNCSPASMLVVDVHNLGEDFVEQIEDASCVQALTEPFLPVYEATAQEEREHVTDGSPCWCDPVILDPAEEYVERRETMLAEGYHPI